MSPHFFKKDTSSSGLFFLFCFSFAHNAFAQSLNQKLDAQWARYGSAQSNLLAKHSSTSLPPEQRIVSRAEWESWLAAPSSEYEITQADIADIANQHRVIIQNALLQARQKSAISFDAMRNLDFSHKNAAIKNFCAAFPKGGMLHVHPSGSYPADALANAFYTVNPIIPAKEIADYVTAPNADAILYPHEVLWLRMLPNEINFLSLSPENRQRLLSLTRLPSGTHSFERFEPIFWFLSLPVTSWETYESLLRAFAERAAKQHVRYVEFTSGMDVDKLNVFEPIAKRIERDYGVTIRFNASFSRNALPEEHRQKLSALLAINHPLLVGIDLLSNEENAPALERGQIPYAGVLAAVRNNQSGIHRTMHAGELGDARNPRDAMIMGAERLGHGVKLALDTVATEYARLNKIAIEANLTSNVKLRAVSGIEQHPFLAFLRLGIPVSLSTDDEGIFETDINTECEKAVSQTNIQYAEMRELTFNSIRTSFLPAAEKSALLKLVESDIAAFETHHKSFTKHSTP